MFTPELMAPMIGGIFQSLLSTFFFALVNMLLGTVLTPIGGGLPGLLGGLMPGFL